MTAINLRVSKKQRGQTLIMALLILGVLLVLGLVFLGFISRNIKNAGNMQRRSKATDLAEAGVRYAHFQLLYSELGADWRPVLTSLGPVGTDITADPDMLYLRPGSGFPLRRPNNEPQVDLGGPDGLGPFTRVNFEEGRDLIRVRFAPSDSNIFSTDPQGSIRNPGKPRYYTIIESVGRPGRINVNDPTTLPSTGAVRFRNYPDEPTFRAAFEQMKDRDRRTMASVESRKITAFASIGIIESGRFITNKYGVTRDAEIGVPDLGMQYEGVPVRVPLQLGGQVPLAGLGDPPQPPTTTPHFGGGMWSNASLRVHGIVNTHLNYTLGDLIAVYGSIIGADANATMNVYRSNWAANAWQIPALPVILTNAAGLNSNAGNFSTVQGVIRDGNVSPDLDGFPRAIAQKVAPSILLTDPETGQNRYVLLTRESGVLTGNGNSGRHGHGRGIYVNNFSDRQLRTNEDEREDAGSQESLFHEWLNPNAPGGSWKGPYYVPRGSYLLLHPDGFSIIRDGRAPNSERTWRNPDGSNTNSTAIRYRIGNVGGVPYIINNFTPGANFAAVNPNYAAGQPFNGVIYFEGNVRVRGIIPIDRQLTVVSNANIYVEGSITKGLPRDPATGNYLAAASKSMLMMMAKDYVALNTTQFFGPAQSSDVEEPAEQATSVGYNPIRMSEPSGRINIRFEELLDPTSGANAALWRPYAMDYNEFVDPTPGANTGPSLGQTFIVTHTQEDGQAPYAFASLDVNFGLSPSTYLFAQSPNNAASQFFAPNYVTPPFTTAGFLPMYGLGVETWQRYSKFETLGFPMVIPGGGSNYVAGTITMNSGTGQYRLLSQETNDLTFTPTNVGAATNSYYLARAAMIPHDIRIEASMYAEEGSFFVIPGQWFNPNPNDTRENYVNLGATNAERDQARKEAFGTYPESPFYGEPIDVRVQIIGAVSENMPPPISQQAEWLKKWGWIPRQIGATGRLIPKTHVPAPLDIRNSGADRFVPNLIFNYDISLATARVSGFDDTPGNPIIRTDSLGRPLPPMPRLPVSPTLAFFGEVNP